MQYKIYNLRNDDVDNNLGEMSFGSVFGFWDPQSLTWVELDHRYGTLELQTG